MSIDPAVFRALVANGATPEMLLAVVEAAAAVDEDKRARKRAGNAERQQRWRDRQDNANNANNALQAVTERDGVTAPSLDKETSPRPPKEINPTPGDNPTRVKPTKFELPSDIPETEWAGFEEMRRRIGKPMTDRARTLAIGELRKLADDGYPPGEVLNHSTMNSYQGIFPPKDRNNGRDRQGSSQGRQRVDGFTAALRDVASR